MGKGQAIEDAAYILKAVNPCEKNITDTRTPAELLAAIEEKGKEVDAALAKLRPLLWFRRPKAGNPILARSFGLSSSEESDFVSRHTNW